MPEIDTLFRPLLPTHCSSDEEMPELGELFSSIDFSEQRPLSLPEAFNSKAHFQELREKSGYRHKECHLTCQLADEDPNVSNVCLGDKVSRRFSDIISPANTHIGLTFPATYPPAESNIKWLNANCVSLPNEKFCIAMQYPLFSPSDRTLDDLNSLARLIFESGKNPLILDLTGPQDRIKMRYFYYYYPISPGYPCKTTLFKIVNLSNELYETLSLTGKDLEKRDENVFLSTYEITQLKTEESRLFSRLNYPFWNDGKGIDVQHLMGLTDLLLNDKNDSLKIIHCTAGVGRTGTLIAAAKVRSQLEARRTILSFDEIIQIIDEAILEVRKDRGPACIQTEEQYSVLIHFALHLYNDRLETFSW